jgi:hypothetical protein
MLHVQSLLEGHGKSNLPRCVTRGGKWTPLSISPIRSRIPSRAIKVVSLPLHRECSRPNARIASNFCSFGNFIRQDSCAFTDGANYFLSRRISDQARAIAIRTGHLRLSLSSGELCRPHCPPMLERVHPAGDISLLGSFLRDSTSPTSGPAGRAAQCGLPTPSQPMLRERFTRG